jgi:4-hydroxybenzoate polyprenyltransferase
MLVLIFLGLAYAMPLPFGVMRRNNISRLKDLPLSKTLSIAIGWAALLSWPGFLNQPRLMPADWPSFGLMCLCGGAIFLNVLTRSVMNDMQDALGDRLFGRQTSVTFLGLNRARKFLKGLLLVWSLYILAAWAFFGRPSLILWMWLSGPLYNALIMPRLLRNPGMGGFLFDLLLDGQFIFSGLLACLWLAFVGN